MAMNIQIRGIVAVAMAGVSMPAMAAPVLDAYWSDHAVIQRDVPVLVHGHADAGEAVSGTLGTETARASADKSGEFTLRFAPRKASAAPLVLTVGETHITDLAVGDVWLCSGQSNMEFAVSQSLNAGGEIASSADSELRLLEVPKAAASQPRTAFVRPASWADATPDTVRGFSAACYFMARDLRHKLGVPIGVINSSYGGSRLDPWLRPQEARGLYGSQRMDMARSFDSDPLGTVGRFAPMWEAWYMKQDGGHHPWDAPDSLTWLPVPKISIWDDWDGSVLQKKSEGTVWLRRTVDLTAAQVRSAAVLSLGILDEIDMTFVNGHPVGNTFGWDAKRHYTVPARFLKPGKNEIVMAVSNTWGTGGFTSPASELNWQNGDGSVISLGDGWRYSPSAITEYPPRSPWDANAGLAVRYNAMIAPLGPVALKGAAWYQGESDAGIPGYDTRLTALMAGWRKQFSPDMRFLIVQLANYGAPQSAPAPSQWADLREEQREAVVHDANAELVTAVDLGERTQIHPANKEELGTRLALAAQGIALPKPVKAVREVGAVRVTFAGVDGGLHAWSAQGPIAFELCGQAQDTCRYAAARTEGDDVVLTSDGKPATRVRYAWADSPVVNTYDARDMALPGFEVPISGQ